MKRRKRSSSSPSPGTEPSKPSQALQHRMRVIRRLGYAFFGVVVLYLVVPIVASIIGQLGAGAARDPFSGARVSSIREACVSWSEQLHAQGDHDSVPWEVEARAWRWRCAGLVEATPD